MRYGMITLEELVKAVKDNKDAFPDGMKTPIFSGDFEGNYTHRQHSIESYKTDFGNAVCLTYEMWEGGD